MPGAHGIEAKRALSGGARVVIPDPGMHVTCICCYRNEADIIEAFVRHTMIFCDEILLLDHGSTDESPEIVRQLQREGFPLHLTADATLGNVEVDQTNRLLTVAAQEFKADWILVFDADEFLVGAHDRSFLAAAEPTSCLELRSRSYYSQAQDRADVLNPVERMAHRHAVEDPTDPKVLVPGALVRNGSTFLTQGKHQLFLGPHLAPVVVREDLALAHFSIRSPSQYAIKLASKQLQKCRHISPQGDELTYYNAPYHELKKSYAKFAHDFFAHRLAYKPAVEDGKMIRDPIDYRGGPLRYTPSAGDQDRFTRDLLDLSETLARSAEAPGLPTTDETGKPRRLTVELTSHPSPGHTEVANTVADPIGFRAVILAADCPPDTRELHFRLRAEPGLVEIAEIVLYHRKTTKGTVYRLADLEKRLRVATGGVVIAPTDVFRFLISKDPVLLVFSDWRKRDSAPPEDVLLRLRVEHRLVPSVLLSPIVFERFAEEQREHFATRVRLQETLADLALHVAQRVRQPYLVGTSICFARDGNSRLFVVSGWHAPEDWGTWTSGERASLRIPFETAPRRPLRLEAALKGFVNEKNPRVRVRVHAGGDQIAEWILDSADPRRCQAAIPAEKLSEDECEIAFEILDAASPAELGISVDARRLGVGMESLEFQWADELEPTAAVEIASSERSNGNVE